MERTTNIKEKQNNNGKRKNGRMKAIN